MKKVLTWGVMFLLVVMAVSGCKSVNPIGDGDDVPLPGELNIMTWIDYVPEDVMTAFEEETGVRVNRTYISSNEEMLTQLRGHKNTFDVIVCSNATIAMMVEEGGLIQPLDKEQIPNYGNISPAFMSQYYDPENLYTVPHAAYAMVLVYNKDAAVCPVEVTSYADLWNPALEGKVVLLDDMRDTLSMVLASMGESVNAADDETLEAAKDRLLALRPNVVMLDADRPHESLLSGSAVAGVMYGSQAVAAIQDGKEKNPPMDFAVVYPAEGLVAGVDCYVVADGAPNAENAMAFLNYVLKGNVSARISEQIAYINCNQAATPFLSEAFLSDPVVNIPLDLIQAAQKQEDVGDAVLKYDDIWLEFKN